MENKNKLHIQIKSRNKNPFYTLYARFSAKRLGLKTHRISKNNGNLEMVFEGSNPELWKMIKHCKQGVAFSFVEEVHFEFVKVS